MQPLTNEDLEACAVLICAIVADCVGAFAVLYYFTWQKGKPDVDHQKTRR